MRPAKRRPICHNQQNGHQQRHEGHVDYLALYSIYLYEAGKRIGYENTLINIHVLVMKILCKHSRHMKHSVTCSKLLLQLLNTIIFFSFMTILYVQKTNMLIQIKSDVCIKYISKQYRNTPVYLTISALVTAFYNNNLNTFIQPRIYYHY